MSEQQQSKTQLVINAFGVSDIYRLPLGTIYPLKSYIVDIIKDLKMNPL